MKKKISIGINLFVGVMSIVSWTYMAFFSKRASALSSGGMASLKYFTVLSNLFNGAVSFLYVWWMVKGKAETRSDKTLKLVATACVGLTFVTVMVFLGPLYGYNMMFLGANLWMHLILPVLSMLSFMVLERGKDLPFVDTLWAVVPAALYSVGYVLNILVNGKGSWPDTNDFYGFLAWGNWIGAVIALTICFIIWLIAVVLYWLGKAYQKKD